MPLVYKPKKFDGRTVYVINNDVNRAINKLRHISAPIMKEIKEKRYFEKPSVKRRRKKKEGIINSRRQARLREMHK